MPNNYNDPNNAHPPIDMTLPKPTKQEFETAKGKFVSAKKRLEALNLEDYRKANLGKISQEKLDKQYNELVKAVEDAHKEYRETKIRGGF